MTRGFTLFFAVLIASLALSIGLTIYDLTVRELDLSSTVEQSQYAIYAADTGAECALFWDAKYNGSNSAFATSSQSTPPTSGITCNAQDIAAAPWTLQEAAAAATSTFALDLSPECAIITVAKIGNPAQTTVTSYGFNNGSGATCAPGSTLQVERILQVSY